MPLIQILGHLKVAVKNKTSFGIKDSLGNKYENFGKVIELLEIGEDITISTVQTMDKIDPRLYEDEFDVVIIDEASQCDIASCIPVDAPDGTEASARHPLSSITSAETVGVPRESSISLAFISFIFITLRINFHKYTKYIPI